MADGTASPGTPDGGSPDPAPRDQGGASWTLESWVDALSAALGIDPDVPVTTLLDSTREVAHQVARPAAPLTLYLVGYAVAQRGGGPDDIAVALDTVRDLIAAGPDGAA